MARTAILMYHSVSSSTTAGFRRLTVDPSLFDEHIAALAEADVSFRRVREVPARLAAADDRARATVAISIDDGLADLASGAAPALAARGVPATAFIPTAYVGAGASWLSGDDRARSLLSWSAIEELAAGGLEIGSHGHLHLAADINDAELVREDAARSRNELEEHLGRTVTSYAYPFGYWTPAARRAVRAAGFTQACTATSLHADGADDRFSLPRLHVGASTTPEMLVRMVCSRPARARREWVAAKQIVWRAGRRWARWGPPEAAVVFGDCVPAMRAEA
jgi:peptidoglycan/xylan/chitin deacetylase (PgdA/CDA1 family)